MRLTRLSPFVMGVAVALALPTIALAGDLDEEVPESESAPVPESEPKVPGATPEAIACRRSFSAGSGNGQFSWCFTSQGTLGQFSSSGVQHLSSASLEGYVLCGLNGVVVAANFGTTQSGLSAPTFPAANVVTRTTSGSSLNGLRIKSTFTNDAADRTANITMEFTNTSGAPTGSLGLFRVADFDVNGSATGDTWYATKASATAVDVSAMTLSDRSSTVGIAGVTPYGSAPRCVWTNLPQFSTGDNMALVLHPIALNPGQSTTLKFAYSIEQ